MLNYQRVSNSLVTKPQFIISNNNKDSRWFTWCLGPIECQKMLDWDWLAKKREKPWTSPAWGFFGQIDLLRQCSNPCVVASNLQRHCAHCSPPGPRPERRRERIVWLVVDLPLRKIWVRQLGWFFPIYGKNMFQTTNQSKMIRTSQSFKI